MTATTVDLRYKTHMKNALILLALAPLLAARAAPCSNNFVQPNHPTT